MTNRRTIIWTASVACLVACLFLGACDSGNTVNDVGDAGKDAKSGHDNNGGFDGGNVDDGVPDDGGICGESDITLELKGVKVMLLVDFSASMALGGKWAAAKNAINQMVNDPANAGTEFGLHLFPKPGMLSGCGTTFTPAVMVGPGTGPDITKWMNDNDPTFFSLSMTPLVEGLKYYLGIYNTPMQDPKTANYVVVLSDGEDSCFGLDSITSTIPYPFNTPNILSGVTDDLKNVSGIKTFAIGLGSVSDSAKNQLNAIAAHGGTSKTSYIAAADQASLTAALDEIAKSIRPCRFLVDSPEAATDTTKVNFYFDGTMVDRDRKHQNGWDWTRSEQLEVEFYGDACTKIKSGTVAKVKATFGCPTTINGKTCAKNDSFLKFPGVATMILQDVSGSMIYPMSKWSGASTAITNMLTDDRNDFVQFGFDPFPSDNLCSVADSPLLSVGGDENRLAIIEWMTSNMPSLTGETPLAGELRRFINRPAGLDTPGLSGVIVVISDGGDSCADTSVATAEQQLKAVTEELVSRHNVRVFAVGYGNSANAAQLNAIALAGNTGLTAYQNANNQADLEKIFKQISSMVTSCVFDVPYAGPNADYSRTNFYFDGDAVPRDPTGKNGWNWVNEVTKEKVEFFGDYCQKLRNGEVTDVVVEFGCETILQ